MFKKILAAGAVLALFACSSNDGGEEDKKKPNNSSPSQGGGDDISSSSGGPSGPSIVQVDIALNGEQPSILLNTPYYTYSLKASSPEDLTQFWDVANCPVEKQDTKPAKTCQLDMTNAILQQDLTTQYSPLHYDKVTTRINSLTKGITLKEWNLSGNGDEAALGLNVYTDEANIQNMGERGITSLNKIVSFEYKYVGGAHEFRVGSKTEADFWYYEIPATGEITLDPRPEESEYKTITIPISELRGMGSFATNGTPFDIKEATKFLWAVQYKGNANDRGSLVLYEFRANVEQ